MQSKSSKIRRRRRHGFLKRLLKSMNVLKSRRAKGRKLLTYKRHSK